MTVKDQLAESGISRYFKDYLKEKSVKSISIKITKDGCDFSIVKMGSFDGAQADFRTCLEFFFKEDFITALSEESEMDDMIIGDAMKLFDIYDEFQMFCEGLGKFDKFFELNPYTRHIYFEEIKEREMKGNYCDSCESYRKSSVLCKTCKNGSAWNNKYRQKNEFLFVILFQDLSYNF